MKFLTNQTNALQVSEAYETLIDANRRVFYDAKLRSQRGTPRLSRVQRTQWDVFDGGAEMPSWAPPPRRPTYDWASGFQQRQPDYSSYHYWHKFEGGHRPSTPDPRPSWDNNGPRPGPEPPNDYPSWDNAQKNWQSYTPPSPDWDKMWVKDQQEKAERLKKEREAEQVRQAEAENERHKRQWPLRQMKLLNEILDLDDDIARLEGEIARSKLNRTGNNTDDNRGAGEIFDQEIMLNSRKRKLQQSLGNHVAICKQQRKKGWVEQAEKAEKNLSDARAEGAEPKVTEQKEREQKPEQQNCKGKEPGKEKTHGDTFRGNDQQDGVADPRHQEKPGAKTADTKKETGSQKHLREWLTGLEHPNLHLWSSPNTSRPSPPPPDPPSTTGETDPEPLIPDLKQSVPTSVSSDTHNDSAPDPHLSHLEVHRGFWEFASGKQKCAICLEEGAALQCPMCDKMFCGACKGSYARDSVPSGVPTLARRW